MYTGFEFCLLCFQGRVSGGWRNNGMSLLMNEELSMTYGSLLPIISYRHELKYIYSCELVLCPKHFDVDVFIKYQEAYFIPSHTWLKVSSWSWNEVLFYLSTRNKKIGQVKVKLPCRPTKCRPEIEWTFPVPYTMGLVN